LESKDGSLGVPADVVNPKPCKVSSSDKCDPPKELPRETVAVEDWGLEGKVCTHCKKRELDKHEPVRRGVMGRCVKVT